jgi:hypothetical protein
MAKKVSQKEYDPLVYVSIKGSIREVIPSGEFKLVKGSYGKSFNCGEIFSSEDARIIDHAIRLISTKPAFIDRDSIEWNIAYIEHIKDIFSDFLAGSCGPDSIPETVLAAIKFMRNPVYTTRLSSAIYLLDKVVNGGHLASEEFRDVVGMIPRAGRRWSEDSVAVRIGQLSRYFESGGFKSAMTRSYFKGTLVGFKVPKDYTLRIKFKSEHSDLPPGTEMTIRLQEFPFGHYPESYFRGNYINFGAPCRHEETKLPSNQQTFVGSPYTPDDEHGERTNGLMFLTLYIPHEWIVSVSDYGVGGIVSYPVPSHKYRKGDPTSLNVDMKLPSFTGPYADDVRASASAFAFKENGFLLPYPQKCISKSQLMGFVKGRADSSRTPDIIESVLRAMRKPGLYTIENIIQWQAINRISPADKLLFFYADKVNERHICVTTAKGGGNVYLMNRKLSEQIRASDPQARSFIYNEKSYKTLLGLFEFSITNISQSAISKVIREELLASNNYADYLKSKEYSDDLDSIIREAPLKLGDFFL